MATKATPKRRSVTSEANLTPEQQEALKALYPLGYSDVMMRIDKPNGDFFYAVPFETEEVNYLVKIKVKIDKAIDEDKDLFDDDIEENDQIKEQSVSDMEDLEDE